MTGETHTFELSDPQEAARWLNLARSHAFQETISAVSVTYNGVQYALPRPRGFDGVIFFAEHEAPSGVFKGGERVICNAGEIELSLFSHTEQRTARIDVFRRGKMRFSPMMQDRKNG